MGRKLLFVAAFLAGYVANDSVELIGIDLGGEAFAETETFEERIQKVVEDCEVYVYRIDSAQGYGQIEC